MQTRPTDATTPEKIVRLDDLVLRQPAYALVAGVDVVVIRLEESVSVLYGRCLHRGALMSDGFVDGDNIICGLHGWDYRLDTGVSEYNNAEALTKFTAWVEEGEVFVDRAEIEAWVADHPQPYDREGYLGLYQDPHGTPDEEKNGYIQTLARDGLSKLGHHGEMSAMGVGRTELPRWDDIQLVTAQLWKKPLLDDATVTTELVIGPRAKKPLALKIPIFVSDMSFGALSQEAKTALARGAELAGTGVCSGEGGMLPDEQASNYNNRWFIIYLFRRTR